MNHFLIYNHTKSSIENGIPLNEHYFILFQTENVNLLKSKCGSFYVIGDFISEKSILENFSFDIIKELKGNFYIIQIKDKEINVITSLFSVLPIYYSSNYQLISSDINWIGKIIGDDKVLDKKFILECLLFNYGLFNRTLYQKIKLLPVNSYIELKELNIKVNKHTQIVDLLRQPKKSDKKIVDTIANNFIQTIKPYFPDYPFYIGFTGGFDGRTITSCATYFKKKFKVFSFGKTGNSDVDIPLQNSRQLNLNYKHYDLGCKEYTNSEYLKNAKEYILSTNGGNGFLYPHFLYTTKDISKNSTCMFAGYFGSELFRALHIEGAVSSKALIDLFRDNDTENIYTLLLRSKTLDLINIDEFRSELKELAEEITFYKKNLPADLSGNGKLYFFVFEEVIRKFFGQWISVQQNYIYVRTPFLDYSFIKALLQTNYAGVNMDFLTKNPYKRFNGQVIYSSIIKKTNAVIYKQKTGKGYRPVDVLNKLYLPNLVLPYALKKLKRKVQKEDLDNLGIISGMKHFCESGTDFKNNNLFKLDLIKTKLKQLTSLTPESERDSLLMTLSLLIRYEKDNSIN
jgi:hypothetical protein